MSASGHERRQAIVDAACTVTGAVIAVTALTATVRSGGPVPTPVWVLVAASAAASIVLSGTSRRRGRTAQVAWDDVLLAPTGALVAIGPAIVLHVLGGLVTSLAMRARNDRASRGPRSRLFAATGRDAVAAGVQVTTVASLLTVLPTGPAGVLLAVLAGLVARWTVEQGLLLVRVFHSDRPARLVRPVLLDPVASFGPTGLALGGLLALAATGTGSAVIGAGLALTMLGRVTLLERQLGHREQAAGVLTLTTRLPDHPTEAEATGVLSAVASTLWPDDRVTLEASIPAHDAARWSVVDTDRAQWLVLRRTPGRRPPDDHDQALLDALTQVVNGVLARRRLLATMQDQQTLRTAVLAAVAHDVRSPLMVMTGGAMTLQARSDQLSGAQRDLLLHQMTRSGHRMTRLVQDLLDLERFEHGHLAALTTGTCDPLAVIARIADELELSDRLRVATTTTATRIAMPEHLFARVVENLLSNATKHAPAGTSIWIDCRRIDERVHIAVEDEGRGIPVDARAAVFAAFERLDGALDTHGLGLGLYVVGCFVRACGGRVRVADSPSGGASFRLDLPVDPTVGPGDEDVAALAPSSVW